MSRPPFHPPANRDFSINALVVANTSQPIIDTKPHKTMNVAYKITTFGKVEALSQTRSRQSAPSGNSRPYLADI